MTALTLTSDSFSHNQSIPAKHTCDDKDISPALAWRGVPADTKSLALIVDDPDAPDPAAPKMTWVHWVLYNIPPGTAGLAEGGSGTELPPGYATRNERLATRRLWWPLPARWYAPLFS
jgi:Raf kinase inhibitor-like YbhB/YbcL family protein